MKNYEPFVDSSFNLQFSALHLSEVLRYGIGFDARACKFLDDETYRGIAVSEANDNPYIIEPSGEKKYYQRPLVWSDEDKANLIDAIYNYTDIGKFVVVRKTFDQIDNLINAGETELSFHELVDGKQRLNAIADFMQDKFRDNNGLLYSDINTIHKRRFCTYSKLVIAIIEDATPEMVKRAFLNVNHTGQPMSKEHIEFVKSINI